MSQPTQEAHGDAERKREPPPGLVDQNVTKPSPP